MIGHVLIAGAGDALGQRLKNELMELGWQVTACDFDDAAGEGLHCDPADQASVLRAAACVDAPVDMLVVNVDGEFPDDTSSVLDGPDYALLRRAYDLRCIGALRIINAFLPHLERGMGKRICVVTTRDSSNNACYDTGHFADHITRAPLNMAVTQLFNGLRPEGYTFRLYAKDPTGLHDDWAAEYFTRARSYESWDLKHSDEERIVLRDWQAREVPW